MISQRANFDWMLRDLWNNVPGVQQIVVLSADGLRIAQYGGDPDAADRIAAACSGLQSLAGALATEMQDTDGRMKLVIIEIDGGYFYMMAAGAGAYLAVLTGVGAEAGFVSAMMRDLIGRLHTHLASPPRHDGQTV